MESHLSPGTMRSHIQGLSPAGRSLVSHVVECAKCGEIFRQVVQAERGGDDVLGFLPWKLTASREPAPAVGLVPSVERSHSEPAADCPLEGLSLAEFDLGENVLGAPGASTWSVIESILKESRSRRHENARASERLALLAVELTDRLDRDLYGERLIMDLAARAWVYVSSARRAATHFSSAREACDRAWACLDRGTGDVLDRALVLECDGILSKATYRFDDAIPALRRAEALFSLAGDDHAAGRLGVVVSNLFYLDGQLQKSIEVLQAASQKIDLEVDPILTLSIQHNLAVCLVDVGRIADAQEILDRYRDDYQQHPEVEMRSRWTQGRIHRANGELDLAEEHFISAQQGFVEMGVGYDAAIIALELASLYAEQGRFSEMRRLADEILPIFRSRDMHREALAALAVFQQAARMERVTLKLTKDLASYLQKARHHPNLRFDPGD